MRRLILLGVVVWTFLRYSCTGYAAALLAKTCLDTFHHGDSACAGYNSAITQLTGNATNKSGGNNDFIEIVKADDPELYDILYYNRNEIGDLSKEWRWECTGTNCTDDYGLITGIMFSGNTSDGKGTHLFLYTKNLTETTTVYPTSNQTYRFYKTSYLTAQCNENTLFNQMCDGYAEAYATYVFNEACTANPLYDSECPVMMRHIGTSM